MERGALGAKTTVRGWQPLEAMDSEEQCAHPPNLAQSLQQGMLGVVVQEGLFRKQPGDFETSRVFHLDMACGQLASGKAW